jgi:SAM-dependent methyltransferase
MATRPQDKRMDPRRHGEQVYRTKASEAVSGYAPRLFESLEVARRTALTAAAAVLDVGGGESTLVDDLRDAGYTDLAVLDLSAHALEVARQRLGPRAAGVRWIAADILTHELTPHSVDIWHDRAVFHFLTDPAQRRTYVAQVLRALRPGGYAVVAAFGPEGPTQCRGLPVARYGADDLHEEFGRRFELIDHRLTLHRTPWGAPQQFVYCYCRVDAT